MGTISISQPEAANVAAAVGQLPEGESAIMYRGRAVEKLVPQAAYYPWQQFDPFCHPITGPLLDGGPAGLARRYQVGLDGEYADACHLCDTARRELRTRFPEVLTPDQMYGVVN